MRRFVVSVLKRLMIGLTGLSVLLASFGMGMSVAFAADITYKNEFAPDVFTWRTDSGFGDATNESGGGRNGSAAKRFKSAQYGNRQADLNWDFQEFTGTTWVQLWVKAETAGQRISIQFLDETGARVGNEQKTTLTADWQKLSYQYENFSTVKRIRFGDAGTDGGINVLIDSVIISNVDPDTTEPGEEQPSDVVRYDEDFDTHRLFYEWKSGGASAADTDGYSGNGKMITFQGGGTQFVYVELPSDWSAKADSGTMWISARIKATDYEDSRINLQFRNGSGGLITEAKPTITKEWSVYSMRFDANTNDIKTAASLRFANMGNKQGSIIVDDIIICNVDPETLTTDPPDVPEPEPEPEETALVNDFDPDLFSWSNGGMNAAYTSEGGLYETGGMTISYNSNNQWGFAAAQLGNSWDLSGFTEEKWLSMWVRSESSSTALTEPLKLGIQFRCGDAALGEVKTQATASDGKWYKVIAEIPFDITAADTIRFTNQMGTASGVFVIDDFTITNLRPQEKPPIVPGTSAEEKPVVYINDFDSDENKFTQKAPGGLTLSVGDGGYSGKGAFIGYQGKNQYTFVSQSINASWDMSKFKGNTWIKAWLKAEPTENAVNLEDAVLEIALRNAEDNAGIASGRFTIPADGQWRELYFKVSGSLADVAVIRFSNPMQSSSDVTICIDDFTITNQNPQGAAKPEVRVDSVILTQSGATLTALSDALSGTVTFTVSVSNTQQKEAEVVAIVALYDKRGLPVKILTQQKTVSAQEVIDILVPVEEKPNWKAVVYVWDGWQNIRPVDITYTPKEF
uniref:CBM-cenC domain-containing protein n=1 Tax=uncultured Bacillota bacterium TaxID=344338 RepID=A0A650ENP1_9FIRM|nr:hypothetical protein Firmicute1046_0170 [uncultured Firmicutes bacterium]